jgi:hypothetical protein
MQNSDADLPGWNADRKGKNDCNLTAWQLTRHDRGNGGHGGRVPDMLRYMAYKLF